MTAEVMAEKKSPARLTLFSNDVGIFDAGDDSHRPATARAGFIGDIPVPDRFAAAYGCGNRLSCRFVDIDAEDSLETLRPEPAPE